MKEKPRVRLVGQDGNIFNLLGICIKALKKVGQHDEAQELKDRVLGCDSDQEALRIMFEYVRESSLELDEAFNLLPPELEKTLPDLYSTEHQPEEEKIVYLKFFAPNTYWTWYVLEGARQEGGDYLFFGFVVGYEKEYGYFTLSELESVVDPRCRIERDLYFKPCPLSECTDKPIYERDCNKDFTPAPSFDENAGKD